MAILQQAQPFILASASPRRSQLLAQLGLHFRCLPADIDERPQPHELASPYVLRMAREKAHFIAAQHPDAWVLGSDTCIAWRDAILGKPTDKADAIAMLMRLSGQTHQVLTSVCLVKGVGEQVIAHHATITAHVTLAQISERQASAYWDTGEPADKAGSYAIQGIGGAFVAHCEGSYTGIVGLPLVETRALLTQVGVVHEC